MSAPGEDAPPPLPVDDLLEGLVMTPDERCAEARARADELVRIAPEETTKWRAPAVAACAAR